MTDRPFRARPALAPALAAFLLAGSAATGLAAQTPQPLRFGILPDSDSMPFMVAAAEGYFEREGALVELVAFKSPVERDAAFQARAVDGVISDLIATALAAQGGFEVRAVALTDGRYGLVSGPGGSGDPKALRGKPIGLSSNTIIQYLVDSALGGAGLAGEDIVRTAVPRIPVRLELLMNGQVAAAGLPEPYLTLALLRGGKLVASSEAMALDAGVALFSAKALASRGGEVAKLLRAAWKAGQAINASPDRYRAFLVEKAGFPEEIRNSYRFVTYRKPALPSEASIRAVLAWMRGAGLLKAELAPSALVDGGPLRGW